MQLRHVRRSIPPLTIAAALTLSLAACGDDAEQTASSPSTTAARSSTTVAATSTTASAGKATSSTSAATTAAAGGNIVDVAAGAGAFSVLVEAVKAAGLAETLGGPGPFTVLAPTDASFQATLTQLGTTKERLLADKATLSTILRYHVIAGETKAADVLKLAGQDVASVAGPPLRISVSGAEVRVNDAKVTQVDVDASNGVIHVIDKVLLPPD